MLHWQVFRIVRVPPLNIFGGSSRPIRSQDSVLSTNQRPRFQQNFRLQPNLSPSNAQPLCHCKVTVSISAKYSASAKFEPTQCTATVPLQRHCVYFGKIFGFSKIWTHPMHCHCATAKSLCQWRSTWTKSPSIDIKICQWTANSSMPCHLIHSCVTSTTGITIRIICHPVFIVQLKFMGPLLGHLPL